MCVYLSHVMLLRQLIFLHSMQEIPPFSYVEINGLKIPTPQHAYSVLWDAISGTTGSSAKTALRSLEEHFGVVGKQRGGIRGPRGHTLCVFKLFLFPKCRASNQ
jgi:hypothetical protein